MNAEIDSHYKSGVSGCRSRWSPYTSAGNTPALTTNGLQGSETTNAVATNTATYVVTTPANVVTMFVAYRQINTFTGSFGVTLDGVVINERYSGSAAWSKGAWVQTGAGQARVLQLIPVTAASSSATATTTHTIVITNNDATNLYFTGVGFLMPVPDPLTNLVPYLNTSTNALPAWPYAALYNANIANVMAALHAAGQT